MDPSSAPWRVLEEVPGTTAVRPGEAPTPAPANGLGSVPRSAIVAAALAAALGIGAFFIAFGAGSAGNVVVDGGSPLDGGGPGATSGDLRVVAANEATVLIVEVVGAVERPGVYRVAADARIGDLVAAAGGYGPRVDTDRAARELNLAAPLHDGEQVRVPSRDDIQPPVTNATGGAASGGAAGASGLIELNQATSAELDTLPGIGPVTAAKILASRDEQPFAAVEDLRTRNLVGEKTFDGLKDLVAVR